MRLVSSREAKEVMGYSFIGSEETKKYWQIVPNLEQTIALSNISFAEELLEQAKNNYILVAMPPGISIFALRDMLSLRFRKNIIAKQHWYKKETFAWANGETDWNWWFVRKDILPNSTFRTFHKQKALLGKNQKMPSARLLIYTVITYFIHTGEFLFKEKFARTSSPVWFDNHVRVGFFDDQEGLSIGYCSDYVSSGRLGLASAIPITV